MGKEGRYNLSFVCGWWENWAFIIGTHRLDRTFHVDSVPMSWKNLKPYPIGPGQGKSNRSSIHKSSYLRVFHLCCHIGDEVSTTKTFTYTRGLVVSPWTPSVWPPSPTRRDGPFLQGPVVTGRSKPVGLLRTVVLTKCPENDLTTVHPAPPDPTPDSQTYRFLEGHYGYTGGTEESHTRARTS